MIHVHTDYHFVIGSSHIRQNKPCQDHALGGVKTDAGIIVIADGCSSASHTDIGARILTLSSIKALHEYLAHSPVSSTDENLPHHIRERVRATAYEAQHVLDLTNEHLRATCVYALVTEEGGFAHILGDGHVILKYKNGRIESHSLEWKNNAPPYPLYTEKNLESLKQDYMRDNEGKESAELLVRTWSETGEFSVVTTDYMAEEKMYGHVIPISQKMIEDGLVSVMVCSDGIGTFSKEKELIPIEILITELMSFKTTTGECVKRRLNRILTDYKKKWCRTCRRCLMCGTFHQYD